jgi:hypothetical protein
MGEDTLNTDKEIELGLIASDDEFTFNSPPLQP